MGTLGGFPNPPAAELRRAKPACAPRESAHATREIEPRVTEFWNSCKRGSIPQPGQNAPAVESETPVKLRRNDLAPQVLLCCPKLLGRGGLRQRNDAPPIF